MDSERLEMVRRAIGEMRNERPDLFAVVDAVGGHACPADACRALGGTPASFVSRYGAAMAFVTDRLQALGYAGAEAHFEGLAGRAAGDGRGGPAQVLLPSREVVALWYGGHIFHEAIRLCRQQNQRGLRGLWARFPARRMEVEIALAVAHGRAYAAAGGRGGHTAGGASAPGGPSAAGKAAPSPRAVAGRLARAASRHAPSGIAALAALAFVVAVAHRPPALRRAADAIPALLDEGAASVRGIFDFSSEALKKPDAPGGEERPAPQPAARPARPAPPPEIALPARRMASLAMLPEPPRAAAVPRPPAFMPHTPDIAAPQRETAGPGAGYFGERPEVRIAPPALPRRMGMDGLPGGVSMPAPAPRPQAEKADLKGYRSAGRVGFSSFQASPSLAGELVRLTRIERYLSEQEAGRSLTFEGAHVALERGRAQVSFADGVAFVVAFTLGRLDDIRIFLKSNVERRLHTEEEAVRGIRLLVRMIEAGER